MKALRTLTLAAALLLLSTTLRGGAPVYVPPSGGEDGANIQTAMNFLAGGAVSLCGTYTVGIDLALVRNVAVNGCGPNACTIIATKPGGIVFGFNFLPGQQLAPGYFSVSGCTINLQNTAAAAFSIWSFGDYHDPGQTIYGIRLKDLQIIGAKAVAVQLGRSMGTTLDDIYMQGGNDGVYCFDCGELHAHNVKAENSTGIPFRLWGTGFADDHWSEGAHFDTLIANGTGYGLYVENYGFVTATGLDLTTTKYGPAIWLRGTVRDFYATAFDVGGNTGQGGLTPQPGILLDQSAPQPLGGFARIGFSHGLVYGSSYGAQVGGVKITLDDVNFTGNAGPDLVFSDAHDSSYQNGRADSATGPNVIELAGSSGNAFINIVTSHGMSLSAGAISRDNRLNTR